MAEENKKDKLKEMRRRLYSKGFKEQPIKPGNFKRKEYKVKEKWEEYSTPEPIKKEKLESVEKMSMIKKIFIGSLLFFVAALAFVVFTFYRGGNIASVEDIKIETTGPVSIKGGEVLSIDINIKNESEVEVESASLLVKYPKGVYVAVDSQDELARKREDVGNILPGGSVSKKISQVLFGEENSDKKINFILEFRFKGSSATLEKKGVYDIRISSSPVNLSFSVPKESSLKQEFEMVVNLESNSNNTAKDLMLKIEYPFGFVFSGASPEPVFDNNTWNIGDLAPADKKTIRIRGLIDGQEGDEKVFRASIGTLNKDLKYSIGILYNFISESIVLAKPFLGVNLLINGDNSPGYVSKSEESIRADILWESNILTKIVDGRIKVKINGDVLDKFSVLVSNGGFYRSIDNTIIWDKNSNSGLSVIDPGEKGSVSFTLKSLPLVKNNGSVFKDPQIVVDVSASGKRISDTNVPEEITTSVGEKIKIESDLGLASRIVYFTGPFKNTGPLPPVIEKQTTYTVIWTITNSSNDISSAIVKTTLPTYVKWLGVVSPANENISFNEIGGEVVWKAGDVESGAGINSRAREVAFQIGFLPSASQISKVPSLTGKVILSGKDLFTGTTIESAKKGLSTGLSTDPYFKINQAVVTAK